MKQWNGLIKKEWISMKGWLYGTVGAAILITLIIPFVVPMFLGESVIAVISGLTFWILISLLLPVIVLLKSLKKEMGHPDIWLHSPVSIFKMFGSKAVFAGLVGVVNLLMVTFLGLIHFKLSTLAMDFTFASVGVLGTFILVFFMVSLMVMCIGLFVKVLYYVIKPYMKVFTIPFLFVFIFASAWAIERIIETVKGTAIYEKIATFGPIGNPSKGGFFIEKEHFFFEVDETVFHIGDLLVNSLFIGLLFITATILFERKVRL